MTDHHAGMGHRRCLSAVGALAVVLSGVIALPAADLQVEGKVVVGTASGTTTSYFKDPVVFERGIRVPSYTVEAGIVIAQGFISTESSISAQGALSGSECTVTGDFNGVNCTVSETVRAKAIRTSRIEVMHESLVWGDYVFEDDYELMGLEELRAFIGTNRHLPGVPSAEVVEKEGFDVAQMIPIHMVKIEELVLYAMQADERIRQLQQAQAVLLQRIEALERRDGMVSESDEREDEP